MIRRKPLSLPALLAAAAVALVALAIAGCGGGGDQATAASAGSSPSTTIGVTDVSGLGKVLVDSQGRTAYLFEKDTDAKSMCSGACAQEWPPVTTSAKPSVGDGVTASMVGTTKRSDGTTQVTYNDHPLYRFTGDNNPGDTNGQNVDAYGAEWHVLSPAGDEVEGKAKGSGGGYAY